jgi:thiamine-phosphate pyrophosphorylase
MLAACQSGGKSARSARPAACSSGRGVQRYGWPVLCVAGDLRARMAAARLYLCTDARQRQGDLAAFLDAVLGAGVDVVQLRQKGLEAAHEMAFLAAFRRACDTHGALLAVNDRADIARAVGADVLHLGQDDLPVAAARQIVGPDMLLGLSTHTEDQAAAAGAAADVGYFCTGPVWPTPTKPGRPAPGLDLVRYAAALGARAPWFAIGGIGADNIGAVLAAGARRVVVVRAITEATDPAAAAAALAARIRAAGPQGNGAWDSAGQDPGQASSGE